MLQSRHARVVAGRSKRPPRPRPKGHSAVGPTDGPPKPLRPGRVDLRRWIALGRLAHLRASPDVIPSQQGATRGRLWAYPPAWRASHPISGGVGVESPSDGIPDTRASMRTSHFGRCRVPPRWSPNCSGTRFNEDLPFREVSDGTTSGNANRRPPASMRTSHFGRCRRPARPGHRGMGEGASMRTSHFGRCRAERGYPGPDRRLRASMRTSHFGRCRRRRDAAIGRHAMPLQ